MPSQKSLTSFDTERAFLQAGRIIAFFWLILTDVLPARADKADRAREAADLILKLCIASGADIAITKQGNSIEVNGSTGSLSINKRERESTGLVGGISKEITALSAQQASEARTCAQKYLGDLVSLIINDTTTTSPDKHDKRDVTQGPKLKICNLASDIDYVAVAGTESASDANITVSGWYQIDPGQCKSFSQYIDTSVLYFAYMNSDGFITKKGRFGPWCVDHSSFKYILVEDMKCESSAMFEEINVGKASSRELTLYNNSWIGPIIMTVGH
jgi:uncharacterized membrane protein